MLHALAEQPHTLPSVARGGVMSNFRHVNTRVQPSEFVKRSSEFGKQKSEYGVRKAELGVRKAEIGVRKAEIGVRSSESGVRSTESGARSTESGDRSTEFGKRSSEHGKRRTELGVPVGFRRELVSAMSFFSCSVGLRGHVDTRSSILYRILTDL